MFFIPIIKKYVSYTKNKCNLIFILAIHIQYSRENKKKKYRIKWGLNNKEDNKCECGERQTDEHLLNCTMNPTQCTKDELARVNKNAIDICSYTLAAI